MMLLLMIYAVMTFAAVSLLADILWYDRFTWYTLTYLLIIVAASINVDGKIFLFLLLIICFVQIVITIGQYRSEDPWMSYPAFSITVSVITFLYVAIRLTLESSLFKKQQNE